MKFGTNAISIIGQMRENFEGTVDALHEAGCAFLEPCGDWGAGRELLDICEKQAGVYAYCRHDDSGNVCV